MNRLEQATEVELQAWTHFLAHPTDEAYDTWKVAAQAKRAARKADDGSRVIGASGLVLVALVVLVGAALLVLAVGMVGA